MSDCPKCGCTDLELVSRHRLFGSEVEVKRCRHCGTLHRERVEAKAGETGVIFIPLACPHCGSERVRVYCTKREGTRYHRCQDCGGRFKSIRPA
jgi:uncharacterized Zn finger protein